MRMGPSAVPGLTGELMRPAKLFHLVAALTFGLALVPASHSQQPVEGKDEIVVKVIPDRGELARRLCGMGAGARHDCATHLNR